MEITEAAREEVGHQEQQGFQFVPLPDDGKLFPNLRHKDIQAKFFQWYALTHMFIYIGG